MVGGPSWRSGSGRGTLLEVLKWSGNPPVGLEVVGVPFWRSGDPPGGPEVVGGPSRRFGSGWGTLPEVLKWSSDPPEGLEVVGGPPRGQEVDG